MPFIIRRTKDLRIDVYITRNVTFLTPPKGKFVLTEADTKQLQAICPGFCFTYLEKLVCLLDIGMPKIDFFGKEDMYLLKNTEYKIPLTE